MNIEQPIEFTIDQFKTQNKDIAWLCRTVKNAGCAPGPVNAAENTVEWLNQILRGTDFFERVSAAKKALHLSDEMKSLRDETAGHRGRTFEELSPRDRSAVRRLNRLALEAAFPIETPRCAYRLTALVRTGEGDSFQQDYRTREDFRRDMKERRGDIEWGLLVRADLGTVVAEYHSAFGDRDMIGVDQIEPNMRAVPEGLSPVEAALREAAMRDFRSNKRRRYILGQMNHINGSRQLSETIRFLFEEKGKNGVIPPLEEIIAEQESIEVKIGWLKAICSEMESALASLKEVEEGIYLQLRGQSAAGGK